MPSRFNSPFSLGIGQQPAISDPRLFEQLAPIYNALNRLQQAFTDYTGADQQIVDFWDKLRPTDTILAQNAHRLYLPASEAIVEGGLVNLYNNAGALNARNANATNNTKPCHAYCSQAGGAAGAGAYTEVIVLTGLAPAAGLTVGTRYFLSTVNGLLTAVAPVAAGNIEQVVGVALSATEFLFNASLQWVQH